MHLAHILTAGAALVDYADAVFKPSKAVLLSKVASLTLRKDALTTHRRAPPIPQLRCTGGNAKGLYEIDVMRCKNQGSDYEDEDIQWTCQASLPPEFKLGSTGVICEGYDSPDDVYVFKGSCGVEYRLMLTEKGEQTYLGRSDSSYYDYATGPAGLSTFFSFLFWVIFVVVAGWIIYGAFIRPYLDRRQGRNPIRFPWGGGGGGGDDPGNDPPPPYDYGRPRKAYPSGPAASSQQQGWRPGFWTGALGGAAAGYFANQRQQNRSQNVNAPGMVERGSNLWRGNGEGSSRSGARYGSQTGDSGGPSFSSTRYESTGFGSTRRR